MVEFYAKPVLGRLQPIDEAGEQALAEMDSSKVYRVKATRSRSLPHHRLFFALLQKVYQNSGAAEQYPSFETFVDVVKIGAGRFEWVQLPTGKRYPRALSIAFDKMGQDEFNAFFDEAVDCIANKLHLVDAPDLRREFEEMLIGEVNR